MAAITIVTINNHIADANFDAFQSLPVPEKIQKLESVIRTICQQLADNPATAENLWILTWREYAITEGKDQRSLTPENKKLYKDTLHKIALEFKPNLVLVAGTVSTTKLESNLDKLSEIVKYYEKHQWIKEKEEKISPTATMSKKELHFISDQLQNIEQIKENLPPAFNIVRNTCYVFSGDDIWSHDKISGIRETYHPDETIDPNASPRVFRPGKGKNLPAYIEIAHPMTQEKITLGIEICRENWFGVLRKQLEAKTPPYIQFVLSDWAMMRQKNLIGQYVIQADSNLFPRLITRAEDLERLPVEHYQINLFAPHQIEGPLQPVYPFELKVYDKITTAIHHKTTTNEQKEILKKILWDFYKECHRTISSAYTSFKKQLDKLEVSLASNYSPASANSFFSSEVVKTLLIDLNTLIRSEQMKPIAGSDLYPKHPAPLENKIQMAKRLMANFEFLVALKYLEHYKLWEKINLTPRELDRLLRIAHMQPLAKRKESYHHLLSNAKDLLYKSYSELDGNSFLHQAIELGDPFYLRILLEFYKNPASELSFFGGKPSLNQVDVLSLYSDSPLHYAITERKDKAIIELLLKAGADISLRTPNGLTATQLAEIDYPEIVDLLNSYTSAKHPAFK